MVNELSFIDLIQYGAMGVVLTYFIVQDFFDRKHRRVKEQADANERKRKDDESAQREHDCVKASEQIRKHQMEIIAPLIHTSNQLHKATLGFMRRKSNTPLPDLNLGINITDADHTSDDSGEDETRILHRKK